MEYKFKNSAIKAIVENFAKEFGISKERIDFEARFCIENNMPFFFDRKGYCWDDFKSPF